MSTLKERLEKQIEEALELIAAISRRSEETLSDLQKAYLNPPSDGLIKALIEQLLDQHRMLMTAKRGLRNLQTLRNEK